MSKKEMRTGIITCPDCHKVVPDSYICAYCGRVLKDLPLPSSTPMEIRILKCLGEGASSIDDVLDCADGSIESVRVTISKILKLGLVSRTRRGRYTLTKAGEWTIRRDTGTDISDPKEIEPVSDFVPLFIRRSAMNRLLKRAGDARAGAGSMLALINILETLGERLATRAVELAGESGRSTVVLRDMELAIQEIIGEEQSDVKGN